MEMVTRRDDDRFGQSYEDRGEIWNYEKRREIVE